MLVINKHFACMQKDLLLLCTHIACMHFVSNQQHVFAVVMRSYCTYAFRKQSTAHVCCCYAFILYACILQAINSTCLLLLCVHIVCMHFASNYQHMHVCCYALILHLYIYIYAFYTEMINNYIYIYHTYLMLVLQLIHYIHIVK